MLIYDGQLGISLIVLEEGRSHLRWVYDVLADKKTMVKVNEDYPIENYKDLSHFLVRSVKFNYFFNLSSI